jgi:hypothetical protein
MWIGNKKEIHELLSKWSDSNAQVWEYVAGHGTLLVNLFRPNSKLKLYVQCKDCRTVRFPSMGWKNASLQLRQNSNPLQNEVDFKFEIYDGEKFYAACWGVYLLETEKPVFIDWPPESRKTSEKYLVI